MKIWIPTKFLPKHCYYYGMRGLKKKTEMAADRTDVFFLKSRRFRPAAGVCLFPDKIVYRAHPGALIAPGNRVFP
jgi:hypothetical protein